MDGERGRIFRKKDLETSDSFFSFFRKLFPHEITVATVCQEGNRGMKQLQRYGEVSRLDRTGLPWPG